MKLTEIVVWFRSQRDGMTTEQRVVVPCLDTLKADEIKVASASPEWDWEVILRRKEPKFAGQRQIPATLKEARLVGLEKEWWDAYAWARGG